MSLKRATRMYQAEIIALREDLAAAKLREAKEKEYSFKCDELRWKAEQERDAAIRAHAEEQTIAVQMQQERDAALSALEVSYGFKCSRCVRNAQLAVSSAVLAERDK